MTHKKHSRFILFTAGLAVAALPALRAGDDAGTGSAPTDQPRAERRGMRPGDGRMGMFPPEVMEKLGLSEDQKAKLKAIHEKYQPQFEALRNESAQDREALREKVMPVRQAMQKEFQAVLTSEQKVTLAELRKNRMRGPGAPGRGPEGAHRRPPPPDQGNGPAEPPPPPPQ